MKILAVGGGSGGHVTPVAAVLKELNTPDTTIRFWCDKQFAPQARQVMADVDPSLKVEVIVAGKFRRYHHLSLIQQLLIPSIVWGNLIDAFRIMGGFIQSFFKLLIWRPDVVFTKGGFVCLPVGIMAWVLRVPLVIHDSDALPGLTNRVLARFATRIATGAPLKYYNYDPVISRYIGIPINSAFTPPQRVEKTRLKRAIGCDDATPLVVITGGGLGAERMNNATIDQLTTLTSVASIYLISGAGQYQALKAQQPEQGSQQERFILKSFVAGDEMVRVLTAADIVVARAGATTLLELAALAKPTIIIPNARLTGGHQLKNAAIYEDAGAAIVLNEEAIDADPTIFSQTIVELLNDENKKQQLGQQFYTFAKPQAAKDMAQLINEAAE